jgi:hypothetical protein
VSLSRAEASFALTGVGFGVAPESAVDGGLGTEGRCWGGGTLGLGTRSGENTPDDETSSWTAQVRDWAEAAHVGSGGTTRTDEKGRIGNNFVLFK